VAACIICLAGCRAEPTSTTGSTSSAGVRALKIGEAATLRGPHPGEELRATLLAYSPNLTGTRNDHPEFDYQFVAARMRLSNVGRANFTGAPAAAISITSTEQQTSRRAHLSEGACATAFAREVTLAPGQSAEGCIPAQILVVSTSASLRFAPYPGRGQAAMWSLSAPPRRHR